MGHGYVKTDPAIERWNTMREEAFYRFRFNSRTTKITMVALVLIPGSLFYFCNTKHLKWDWTAKRKGEPL
ncbi:hypothetical protein FIBSPDRAFT_1041942 [Athelia psychrophila]|uniref:Complex I-B15 n=1 Tax=Athelia psychrophila TaxID=1759441 RepID=A0A166NB43_9AGAM|nr:hypothetical protein FIBSPDRAFT_1041942 [Fibularhizoctonia sp. CBS 109695]